jgi:hypothetical protein
MVTFIFFTDATKLKAGLKVQNRGARVLDSKEIFVVVYDNEIKLVSTAKDYEDKYAPKLKGKIPRAILMNDCISFSNQTDEREEQGNSSVLKRIAENSSEMYVVFHKTFTKDDQKKTIKRILGKRFKTFLEANHELENVYGAGLKKLLDLKKGETMADEELLKFFPKVKTEAMMIISKFLPCLLEEGKSNSEIISAIDKEFEKKISGNSIPEWDEFKKKNLENNAKLLPSDVNEFINECKKKYLKDE